MLGPLRVFALLVASLARNVAHMGVEDEDLCRCLSSSLSSLPGGVPTLHKNVWIHDCVFALHAGFSLPSDARERLCRMPTARTRRASSVLPRDPVALPFSHTHCPSIETGRLPPSRSWICLRPPACRIRHPLAAHYAYRQPQRQAALGVIFEVALDPETDIFSELSVETMATVRGETGGQAVATVRGDAGAPASSRMDAVVAWMTRLPG